MALKILIVLLYLLIGSVYSLCYSLVYKPDDSTDCNLGLLILFWPVYLVLDVVLELAAGFGRTSRWMLARLKSESVEVKKS